MLIDTELSCENIVTKKIDFSPYSPRKLLTYDLDKLSLLLPNGKKLVYRINDGISYMETSGEEDNKKLEERWIVELEKRINGYMTDYVIKGEIVYLVTDEGCYYEYCKKRNSIQYERMISELGFESIVLYKEDIVLLDTTGKIWIINRILMGNQRYNNGSVWNFACRRGIVAAGRDGALVFYDKKTLKTERIVRHTNGWINSVKEFEEQLIYVTSRGEIVIATIEGEHLRTIAVENSWINNFVFLEEKIYFVTAQGFIGGYNLDKNTLFLYEKICTSQLIDISSSGKYFFLISVEGDFLIWDIGNRTIAEEIFFPLKHFTSIAIIKDRIYIATMDGEIIEVEVKESLKNIFSVYKQYKIADARIWKICTYMSMVIGVTNNNQIFLLYEKKEYCSKISFKDKNTLFTTCAIIEELAEVVVGCSNGRVFGWKIEEIEKESEKIVLKNKYVICKAKSKYLRENSDNAIRMFVDDKINYHGRLIRVAEREKLRYVLSQVRTERQKQMILDLSGWDRYPLFFWNGVYWGSGVLLTEMIKSGVIKKEG